MTRENKNYEIILSKEKKRKKEKNGGKSVIIKMVPYFLNLWCITN
jgi:hypothetical protein